MGRQWSLSVDYAPLPFIHSMYRGEETEIFIANKSTHLFCLEGTCQHLEKPAQHGEASVLNNTPGRPAPWEGEGCSQALCSTYRPSPARSQSVSSPLPASSSLSPSLSECLFYPFSAQEPELFTKISIKWYCGFLPDFKINKWSLCSLHLLQRK